MAVSRAERRVERKLRVVSIFGDALADPVLDLLEITELAWHDCYNEISPSEEIIDDILLCSGGDIPKLIRVVRLALSDWRDLKVMAMQIRASSN
jgi:hypothetical protein